jgi:hypothetical protein
MAGVKGRSGPKRDIYYLRIEEILRKGWPKRSRLAVIRKLAEKAEEGDTRAAKLLLEHAYGRPVQRHQIAGAEGGPLTFLDLMKQARSDDDDEAGSQDNS